MRTQSIYLALAISLAMMASSASNAFPKADQAAPTTAGTSAAATGKPKRAAPPVDLNRAGTAALKKLPGVGDAEAAKIVAGRPYKSKTDLVAKNVLTLQAYDRLSKQVVVEHRKSPPKAKS